jgi:hypothetical protein
MKKTLTLWALIALTISSAFAQKKTTVSTISSNKGEENPRMYLGLSGGFNNVSGLFGITLEAPFSENVSGKIGLGVGGWGTKVGVSGKYYKQYATSWSWGLGYSTASGIKDFPAPLSRAATPNTSETVRMKLDRSHNIDLVAGKSWGKKVRFGLELGYSIPVAGGTFMPFDKSIVLSEVSTKTMDLLSPGGLILGLGLMFRL